MIVLVYISYITPLSIHENHVFYPFGPYSALIRPCSGQSGMKVTFDQTSQLRLERKFIYSNCTKKLCNTTPVT